MSRFESLEFDDPAKAGKASTGTPVRNAGYFLRLADKAFLDGTLESALKYYSKGLEQDRLLFPCWLGQVRILIDLGEYKEANLWADKALELFPEHPELLAAKSIACNRMGLHDKAMTYSDNAVAAEGVTPYVWIARGEALLQRRSKMTGHCFAQALAACESRQAQGLAHLEISRALRYHRRYSQALVHANDAVQQLPRYALAWLELGRCQAALNLEDASKSIEQALQISPECVAARRVLDDLQTRGLGARMKRSLRRIFKK